VIYADSCVVIKRYVREAGSELVEERFLAERKIFTSVLSYAEVHSALAKKTRNRELSEAGFIEAREKFEMDWKTFETLEVRTDTVSGVRELVDLHPLKGSDAIHLAAALWLRDNSRLSKPGKALLFATADQILAEAAGKSGLTVFNPEA